MIKILFVAIRSWYIDSKDLKSALEMHTDKLWASSGTIAKQKFY